MRGCSGLWACVPLKAEGCVELWLGQSTSTLAWRPDKPCQVHLKNGHSPPPLPVSGRCQEASQHRRARLPDLLRYRACTGRERRRHCHRPQKSLQLSLRPGLPGTLDGLCRGAPGALASRLSAAHARELLVLGTHPSCSCSGWGRGVWHPFVAGAPGNRLVRLYGSPALIMPPPQPLTLWKASYREPELPSPPPQPIHDCGSIVVF